MEFVNHYKVLGVNANVTQLEIQNAYSKLSIKFLKNANIKNNKLKIEEIDRAYGILGDTELRMKYNEDFKVELSGLKKDSRSTRTTKTSAASGEEEESFKTRQDEVKYEFGDIHVISYYQGGELLTKTTINQGTGDHLTEFFKDKELKTKTSLNTNGSHNTQLFKNGVFTAEH